MNGKILMTSSFLLFATASVLSGQGDGGLLDWSSVGGSLSDDIPVADSGDTVPAAHFVKMYVHDCEGRRMDGGQDVTMDLAGKGRVTLKWWQGSFDVTFATDSPSYTAEYAYRLGGRRHHWIALHNSAGVSFQDMRPGRYLLEVRSRTTDGRWSESPATLSIRVKRPPLTSTLAKAAYLFLAICAASCLTASWKSHAKKASPIAQPAAQVEATPDREPLPSADGKFMKKVTALIDGNLQEEQLGVGWLATAMGMSVSTLYRKLKASTGLSASEYIRKMRLRKAAEMLVHGDDNISETAWKAGFGSLLHFRQCFKQEYGQSPSEYRKTHAAHRKEVPPQGIEP